jgi:hypothetical protein
VGMNDIMMIYIFECKVPNFSMYGRVFQLTIEEFYML